MIRMISAINANSPSTQLIAVFTFPRTFVSISVALLILSVVAPGTPGLYVVFCLSNCAVAKDAIHITDNSHQIINFLNVDMIGCRQ